MSLSCFYLPTYLVTHLLAIASMQTFTFTFNNDINPMMHQTACDGDDKRTFLQQKLQYVDV